MVSTLLSVCNEVSHTGVRELTEEGIKHIVRGVFFNAITRCSFVFFSSSFREYETQPMEGVRIRSYFTSKGV